MKDTIELGDGRFFDNWRTIAARYEIGVNSQMYWQRRLPQPVKIGRVNYYDRKEVEAALFTTPAKKIAAG